MGRSLVYFMCGKPRKPEMGYGTTETETKRLPRFPGPNEKFEADGTLGMWLSELNPCRIDVYHRIVTFEMVYEIPTQ